MSHECFAEGMTLLLAITIPGVGVWQAADQRLTRSGALDDEDCPKQHIIQCPDGELLLAFTGLAEVGRRQTLMPDWIRETLRGETRTVDQTMNFLAERAQRDIRSSESLVFHAIGLMGRTIDPNEADDDPRILVHEVANCHWDGKGNLVTVAGHFQHKRVSVDEPMYWLGGLGSRSVSQRDRDLLAECTRRKPREPREYSKLLAAVNRRTSKREDHKAGPCVSRWCTAVAAPFGAQKGAGGQLIARDASEPVAPPSARPVFLFAGIDLTGTMRMMSEFMGRRVGGEDVTLSEYEDALEADGEASVRPRP